MLHGHAVWVKLDACHSYGPWQPMYFRSLVTTQAAFTLDLAEYFSHLYHLWVAFPFCQNLSIVLLFSSIQLAGDYFVHARYREREGAAVKARYT